MTTWLMRLVAYFPWCVRDLLWRTSPSDGRYHGGSVVDIVLALTEPWESHAYGLRRRCFVSAILLAGGSLIFMHCVKATSLSTGGASYLRGSLGRTKGSGW